MKKFLAISLACCLPLGLAAEDPAGMEASFGMVSVLVIEDAAPIARDVLCTRSSDPRAGADCMAVNRAVLTARVQRVSARERGVWM